MIPAVIIGADLAGGLGTARALKGIGTKIIGICNNMDSKCCRSKVWDRLICIKTGEDGFLDQLKAVGKEIGQKSVLFCSQDNIVQLVSDNREKLEEYYYFVLPDKETLNMLMDKTEFHRWAVEKGFDVPQGYVVTSISELKNALNEMKYPAIIKPFVRTSLWDEVNDYAKMIRLNGEEDLKKIEFDLFHVAGKLVMQEWVPGDDRDVHFCLTYFNRDGEELAYYTGRKLLQWPVGCGNTSIAVGTFNEDVHRITKKVLDAAGHRGLGSLEVKLNRENGKYYLIEPTVGRNDLQSYLAVAGGVNLSRIAYLDAIGKEQGLSELKRRGSVWIEDYSLTDALKMAMRMKVLPYRDIMSIVRKRISFSHLSLSDPLPGIGVIKEKLQNCKRRAVHRGKQVLSKGLI